MTRQNVWGENWNNLAQREYRNADLLPLISVKFSFIQWSENRNAASTVLIIRTTAGKYVNGGNLPP